MNTTVNTTVHTFDTTKEAYDATQGNEAVKAGHTLLIEDEGVVGLAWTWPVAVTKAFGELHIPSDVDGADLAGLIADAGWTDEQIRQAVALAVSNGYELADWAEAYAPADLIIEDLSTYDGVLAAYRRLLEDNPGKALALGDEGAAFLLDGHLVACAMDSDGKPEFDNPFDFDRSGWDDECQCWDGQAGDHETVNQILHPTFVDMPAKELAL